MALTKELITKNVQDLTEEQVSKIIKLSENAFQEAISTRIGEVHGQYDADIKSVIGQDKPGGVKTYEWLKNVLSDLKTKAEAGSPELEKLKAEKADLEKKIKDGAGGEAIKQQNADLQNRINELQNKYKTDAKAWEDKVRAEQEKAVGLRIDHEFQKALTGIKFKPEDVMPKSVREVYVDAAKAKILSSAKPDWIDDGQGGQRLVFRNAAGQVMNNPENALNPYTPAELLLKEISPIVDMGKQQPGGGTTPGQPPAGGAFSLNGAKTQPQAAEAIREHLLGRGIENASEKFQEEFNKMWDEGKVSTLPMR